MRIGVFCSGGDAPGMNPCLRAVVRAAVSQGHQVVGICRGYKGLLAEDFYREVDGGETMSLRSVSGLSKIGGTMLHTSRCAEFRTEGGVKKAAQILEKHRIDALIPIGGDGTLRGAVALGKVWNGQIIGCPGTIDNDLIGTDYTIGFATAVHTAVEAVDKLRDTAESHERLFLVEVMGRHSGYIGLYTAIAAGAEVAAIPETATDIRHIVEHLKELKSRGKKSIMMIVSEGDEEGGAIEVNDQLQKAGCPFETRVVSLGHLQRGGAPVPADRILASRMGDFAVRSILAGKTGFMTGEEDGEMVLVPFERAFAEHHPVPDDLLRLLGVLAS